MAIVLCLAWGSKIYAVQALCYTMSTMRTDILILGGGIGGYETYRQLAKKLRRASVPLRITLVDANTYYTFTPMLHEAATGAVEPMHCAISLRELIAEPHQFIQAKVEKIDPTKKLVQTTAGVIEYAWCVVAMGSTVNYFNVPGAADHTYNVRTLAAAKKLHSDLIALLEEDSKELAVTVVGGGWTGVEVAGQYGQLLNRDVTRYYPHKKISITLLESSPAVLARLPARVSVEVAKRLTKYGITVRTNEQVKAVGAKAVTLSSGQNLASDLTIWTTGFENVAACYLPDSMCEKGRLRVDEHLAHDNYDQVYAVGDIAYAVNPVTKEPYAQLGETAVAQAKFVAQDIINRLTKKPRSAFSFRTKGNLIPLGDWDGAAIMAGFTFYGPIAWVVRRAVYIVVIPTWKARLKIMIDWALHSFGRRYILGASRNF